MQGLLGSGLKLFRWNGYKLASCCRSGKGGGNHDITALQANAAN
jgi:hypothetical protein